MLNSQNLINKICAKIACGGLSSLQTCQTTGALSILSTPVCSVSNFSSLPCANNYTGRMIYVDSENRYYYAFNGCWFNDFKSTVVNYEDLAWAWGINNCGQLGDNTTFNKFSPVSVVGGFIDWCQISAGSYHTAAVKTDSSAWAWGCNSSGQLGDNTSTSRSSPVSVVGGFSDWCQISAGGQHTAAVRTNGTAWAWGYNGSGRLGDNTTTSRRSPVSVVGGFSDWCQISAGGQHTAALRTNGSAWAWGPNNNGELGDNNITPRSSPVSVVGGLIDWCQISAGSYHNAAVRTNGSAWAWGFGGYGALGDNTTSTKYSPVAVVGGFSDWCQISAGSSHTAAVRTNGSAWAWGRNARGQLGDFSFTQRSSPISVAGGFSDWCQISAGLGLAVARDRAHTAAVRTNGSAWAWGYNACGQLGDNTVADRLGPVSVVGGFSDWCQISAGRMNTAAVRQVCKGF
jgi:YD repeat-containing protein